MRVGGRVAVAGEVLRAGRHALALRAGDERRDVARDELGIGAEAAHADDGIPGVGVRVGDGREVQVDAGARPARPRSRPRPPPSARRRRRRRARGCRGTSCRARPRAASRRRPPRRSRSAARAAPREARAVSSASCSGSRDVVGEERDPAEPSLEPARDPLRDDVAREARLQAGRGEPVELAHCLTAPAVRPKAIRLCTITKKSTTGRAVSVAAAISVPQSTPRVVPVVKFASQIVIVCLSALESMT